MARTGADARPLRVRLAWFVGIWAASVAALAVVAEILRWVATG
jgi:hypothetical protein